MSFKGSLAEVVAMNENGLLGAHASWARVSLTLVVEIINGFPFESRYFNSEEGAPLLRIRDVVRGRTDTFYTGSIPDGFWVSPGDLVVGMDGDFNCAAWRGVPALLNQRVCKLVADERYVDSRFLHRVLGGYLSAINDNTSSVTVKHLSSRTIGEIPLPLAPLAEQKRIADKLDALLARIYACRERLDRAAGTLKRFRQSVLVAATSGELTREWRGGSDADWTHERAEQVCEKVQSGGTPREGFSSSGVPFLKVYNIVEQRVDFEYKPQYIAPEIHNGSMRKSQALPGDVLMNIVGPPLGKVAIVPDAHQVWNINQAITLFRPSERVSSKWLYYVLCSGENITAIEHETRGTAGQINISLSQCRNFVLPVPSAGEQAEVVRRVDLLLELADSLERRVLRARDAIERAVPSVLAKAFRGELVPQDPSDEPASELLVRVQAQVSAGKAEAKRTRQKGAGKKPSMKSTDKDKIRAVILKLKTDSFSIDELRASIAGDYESTKDALFELLQEPNPVVRQVFDKKAKAMQILRVKR